MLLSTVVYTAPGKRQSQHLTDSVYILVLGIFKIFFSGFVAVHECCRVPSFGCGSAV